MKRLLLALCVAWPSLMTQAPLAQAMAPGEMLPDPVLETRARGIARQIRCVVCQNQSIDDSEAELARDMRRVVRERVAAGASEAEVLDFLVARYGDFVLLDPPWKPKTYLLWVGPWMVLGVAGMVALLWLRHRAAVRGPGEIPPLSPAERARLDALIAELEDGPR